MERSVMQYFIQLALIGLLIASAGCKLSDDEKDLVVNVDTEFVIDLNEKLGNAPSLVFELESVETRPCMNSTIDNTVTFTGTSLRLFINSIEDASDCIPGDAVAAGKAYSGSLPPGRYDVMMDIRNTITNEGTLTISEKKYELEMKSSNGLSFKNLELRRIPEYTIWGYIAAEDEGKAGNFPSLFLHDLHAITTGAVLQNGYYGHFSIESNELILRSGPEDMNFLKTFYFNKSPAEGLQLKALLEQYREEAGSDVIFSIFTWQGETY